MTKHDLIPLMKFLGGSFGLWACITCFAVAVFCLKIILVKNAFHRSAPWGLAVLLVPIADIIFLLSDFWRAWKPFFVGYVFLFVGSLFLGTHAYIQHFYAQDSKLLPKNQPQVCNEFAVGGLACEIVDAKLKRPGLRDAFITFLASRCGDSLSKITKDNPHSVSSIRELLTTLNQTETQTPTAIKQLNDKSIGSSVQCGSLLDILQKEFWEDAGTIAHEIAQNVEQTNKRDSQTNDGPAKDRIIRWVALALSGFPSNYSFEDINFGDSNLWSQSFPKHLQSPADFGEQNRASYLQNLIFIFLARNEFQLVSGPFRPGIRAEEMGILFEQVRKVSADKRDNN